MGVTDAGFPRALMKFHHQLAESRGCNLLVSFVFSANNRFKVPAQVYEIEPSDLHYDITLRLFLHGLQMILPYQKQLFEIHIGDSQPQIDKYVFDLLCSIKEAPRLTVLSLGDVRWYRPAGSTKGFYSPSLKEIWNLGATVPNFQSVLRNDDAKSIGSILSIEHFRSLQSLEISHHGWLLEMALPPQISHLWVNVSREDYCNLRNLAAKPAMCTSLTSLGIWNDDLTSDTPANKLTSFVQEHISLPYLHSIWLGDFAANVISYLTHMHLPRIENASITLNDQEVERSPYSWQNTAEASFPLFTSLSHLYLACNESWIALSVLSRLASPSLQHLNLWFQEEGGHLGPDYDQKFEDCLGRIQPEALEIGSKDLNRMYFVLESLSRSNLKELKLNWYPKELESPPTFTECESDKIRRSIASASLVKLKLVGIPLHLIIGILSSLDSRAIEELTIDLPLDHESLVITPNGHRCQCETSKVKRYALVSKLCFSQLPLPITSVLLRQFFDYIPNVEHMVLDIGSNWAVTEPTHLVNGPSTHKTSTRKFWIPVCEVLRPDADSGLCLLLRLTKLTTTFPLESGLEDLEEPLRMFSRVFRERADAGAPYLKLKLPEERNHIKHIGGDPDTTLVRLTFEYYGKG